MDNSNLITHAEREFIHYKLFKGGTFQTGLYDLYFKADWVNQQKLETTFPELWVARKYSNEAGYWEDLKSRWEQMVEL